MAGTEPTAAQGRPKSLGEATGPAGRGEAGGPKPSAAPRESAEARCIRLMDCSLTETPHGWLAVSAPGSLIRIGVVGPTANKALRAFRASATEWARLHDMPVAPMAGLGEL